MKFIKVKTVREGIAIINVNLIISLCVSYPRPDETWTTIEVAKMASRYYVDRDITKEFERVINSSKDGVFNLTGE